MLEGAGAPPEAATLIPRLFTGTEREEQWKLIALKSQFQTAPQPRRCPALGLAQGTAEEFSQAAQQVFLLFSRLHHHQNQLRRIDVANCIFYFPPDVIGCSQPNDDQARSFHESADLVPPLIVGKVHARRA